MKLKLKTLGLASILTILTVAPVLTSTTVFADGGSGHRAFPYGSYTSKRNVNCSYTGGGYGPAHTVSLIVTHNTSANQTYALAACGCTGRYVQARAELNGEMTDPVIAKDYAQTLSVAQPGQLTAYEMHRVEAN
ncbi:hypothetical protein P8V03_05960 [Clostridium sp. A1-XYC3]|uniref:Uncharacterized protein n=1 Tax=Clostridium tanneri TaxID=3037988 RepID=A0ABU4JRB4_9CLOT|nr:hypothetical protein [Clostridium sp. A1-XYC3]MDW8800696.1 hypothetical protein [Clostridium sp. A1-XYC3]